MSSRIPFDSAGVRRWLVPACTASVVGMFIMLAAGAAQAKMSVIASPHNLSASGSFNTFFFEEEERVCIFCHAPHNASNAIGREGIPAPLWNRELPANTGYTSYASTTMKAGVSQVPTGASRLCLSCHDGTIALSSFGGSTITNAVKLPAGSKSNLSKNLSDDHPISFLYDDSLAALKNGELALPETLAPETRLDQSGSLQCTTCHDAHDNEFGNFLVKDNKPAGSPLCITCHTYNAGATNGGWAGSAHYPVVGADSATGCLNCHQPHTAPQPQRLLRYVNEEDNCLSTCHNTGAKNVATEFTLTYRHPITASNATHDEAEPLPATTYHVECVDCHNPHRAAAPALVAPVAPNVDGPLYGVRINNQGTVATAEFDICLKCHGGTYAYKFSGVSNTPPNRMIADTDQVHRFSINNPSIHPVTTTRTTTKGSLSLISSMSQIYCSDCHGSDQSAKAGVGLTGANGPHGSTYEHILIAEYDMPPVAQYPHLGNDETFYALCYRCHQQSFIMGSASGFVNAGTSLHKTHVQDQGVPCYVCHDPHGVPKFPSSGVGGTTTNNAHLINFNIDYAGSGAVYETLSPGSGSCTVSCHGGATTYALSVAKLPAATTQKKTGVKYTYSP